MTGYKSKVKEKKRQFFGKRKNFEPNLMFAFDIIKGFPIDFDIWSFILSPLMGCKDPIKDGDDAIKKDIEEYLREEHPSKEEIQQDPVLRKWTNSANYEDFLVKWAFVENDQVVVPSLNLKAAKQIFCRNERQIKELRHMGFINDRIKILNSKQWD